LFVWPPVYMAVTLPPPLLAHCITHEPPISLPWVAVQCDHVLDSMHADRRRPPLSQIRPDSDPLHAVPLSVPLCRCLQAVYVPADDLTDPAPATTFAHLDATTVLSRGIAELGIYPAVDPLDSTSRMLDPRILGE
jgi:hypothetical protein